MAGVSLGAVEIKSDVAGTEVVFPVNLTLDISSSEQSVEVVVLADVGMHNLQDNFEAIAKTFPLPRDDSGYGTKVLASLNSASITPAGDVAKLRFSVNFDVWHIEKGLPLGGTTIEWRTECINIPLVGKVCTDVPVKIEPKPGDDIKIKVVEEDVNGDIDIALYTPDGQSLEVRPLKVDVTPGGDIAKFFNEIAGIFNVSLGDIARREIAEVINDGTLRKALPKEVQAFNPVIKTANFTTSPAGKLGVTVQFSARITAGQLTEWLANSIAN